MFDKKLIPEHVITFMKKNDKIYIAFKKERHLTYRRTKLVKHEYLPHFQLSFMWCMLI